jgi:hypothetical protein
MSAGVDQETGTSLDLGDSIEGSMSNSRLKGWGNRTFKTTQGREQV